MRTCIVFMLVACMVLTAGSQAYARTGSMFEEEDDGYADNPQLVVNRPVNVQGLTGLIFTNSAYTQTKGSIVIGASTIAENSQLPDFSIVQGIATVTAGVADRVEVGARAKMIATNIGSSATRESGSGDTDLLVKWRVSSQGEIMPAFAFGLAYTFPTGEREKNLRELQQEGIRLMMLASSEKEIPDDILIGVYLELQLVLNDQLNGPRSTPYSDKYGVFNGGVLVALTENRMLQAIVEYTNVFKKDVATLYEKDYSAVMPGLRFVTSNLNISLGVQFMSRDKDQINVENDERYLGTLSYKF